MVLSSAATLYGYECIRSASNTLFKMDYGVWMLPWVMTLVPLVVAGFIVGYGALLSRLGPRRTLGATMGLSALGLVSGWWGVRLGIRPASAFLYLLKEAYVAAKELLYIPLSFDSRFRAKEVIDAFGYRFGKGASSLCFGLLQSGGSALGAPDFGVASLLSCGAWFFGAQRLTQAKTLAETV